MRFEKASLEHLQSAYQEGIEALLASMGCDPAEITILSGAVVTDGNVTAGWAAYANEVFQIDADDTLPVDPGPGTYVWQIDETFLDSDPVKFDDGNEFNVNQIRKLKLVVGAAGSGIADYDEVVASDWIEPTLLNGWQKSNAAAYASAAQPRYMRKNGIMFLKARFEGATSTANPVLTLPVGYRPDQDIADIQGDWILRANGNLDYLGLYDPNGDGFVIDVSYPLF